MPNIVNVEQAAGWDGPQGAGWVAREELQNAALAAHTERLLEVAAVTPADRVLDVGCGTGDTTRQCARRATEGHALGVDLSRAMLERARDRAVEAGLTNVEFAQADAQCEPFVADTHDLVLSRFGVMFFNDPVAAFTNLAATTAPGGRAAMVVWQAFDRNEWVKVPRAALAMGRDVPTIVDDVPGAFGLADPDRLRHILHAGGYSQVELDDLAVPFWFGPDVETATGLAGEIGVVAGALEGLDDDGRARAFDALRTALAEHETADGVALDTRAWLIRATREAR
jgi:SAM-dependent methyltransferase